MYTGMHIHRGKTVNTKTQPTGIIKLSSNSSKHPTIFAMLNSLEHVS